MLVALMILSLFASVPAAGMADHTGPLTGDQLFEGSTNVDVWERAYIPLRTDMGNTMTTVDNADWRVETKDGEQMSVGKDQMGVYSTGATIQLTFKDERALNSDFGGQSAQLVAAHITGDPSTDIPNSFSEMSDLVSMQGSNDVATFEIVDEKQIDSEGNVAFSHTPSQSGQYVYFLALHESNNAGYTVTNGQLSLDGQATVIGLETAAVQKGASTVSASNSVTRGSSVTFDVDASSHLSGSDITHTVVLYDESTYVNQHFLMKLNEDPSKDFSFADDATLEQSIANVNGVMDVSGNPDIFGASMADERLDGMNSFSTTLEFFADKFQTNAPPSTATGDTRLDASMKVIEGDATEQVVVETESTWSPGTYRWVQVSSTENSDEFVTKTGTITIRRPSSSGGNGGDTDNPPSSTPVDIEKEVTESGSVKFTISNAKSGQTITFDLQSTPASEQNGVKLNMVKANMKTGGEFSLSVNTLDTVPSDTPPVTQRGAIRPLTYINVEHSNSNNAFSGGTFSFTVDDSQLDGEDPANVALYRYNDGEWNALDTKLVGQGNGEYEFEAETPGFSVFALGVKQPQISVTDASLQQQSVTPSEQATVSATLRNEGEAGGSHLVQLLIDGSVEAEQSVQLGAGETTTVTFQTMQADPGSYDIAVNDVAAGTLNVAEQTTQTQESDSPRTSADNKQTGGSDKTPPEQSKKPFGSIFSLPLLIGLVVLVLIASVFGIRAYREK